MNSRSSTSRAHAAAHCRTTPRLLPLDLPLVLLPVRLETRFFALPGDVTELRVRIYPDQIHPDATSLI